MRKVLQDQCMHTMFNRIQKVSLFLLLSLNTVSAFSQSTADEIAKYREMIADGNPSELYEMTGEELWKKPSGPKNASLETCDLGLGPGVVDGAAARLQIL